MQKAWSKKVVKRLKFWKWYDEYTDFLDDNAGICRSDRSWGCVILGVLSLGLFSGIATGWTITYTPLSQYFISPPPFTPEPVYSTSGLWPGVRYDFFTKEPQTYQEARRICADRNATLLTFDDINESSEEKNLDCYLRVRANAEQRRFFFWMHPTLLLGNRTRHFDWENFRGPKDTSPAVISWSLANGCDLLRDLKGKLSEMALDLNKTQKTTYHLVKRFDNYGLRTKAHGERLGCWDQFREDPTRKLGFVCRAKLGGLEAVSVSDWAGGKISQEYRANFTEWKRLKYDFIFKDGFEREFCDSRHRADTYSMWDAIKCSMSSCHSMYHDIPPDS